MKSYSVIKQILKRRPYFRYFLLLWFITISIFLWLVNVNLLAYILSSPILTPIGKIDFILEHVTKFYKAEAENSIQGISQIIEPALILLLGFGVAALVSSILLPMYNVVGSL